MKTISSAPAKIILSGEYAVVFGYPGIAIPANCGITAEYELDLGRPDLIIEWPNSNAGWIEYTNEIVNKCKEYEDQIFGTLKINSTAPLGKGMGSSTALVIAICRALLGESCELKAKEIEDALNIGNSGIDFAVIWNNSAIEFRKGEEPKKVKLKEGILKNMYLIDTGKPEQATPELVEWTTSRKDSLEESFKVIGRCTERVIGGEDLEEIIKDHNKAQIKLGVVPKNVQELIESIETSGGYAKVIGAGGKTGGAGMVLVIIDNFEALSSIISNTSFTLFS